MIMQMDDMIYFHQTENNQQINLLMLKNQEDKPASFIGKLYNILRSKEYAKMIYWDAEQKGIRILNQKKIEEIILPKYFRHNRFSSFVRQLNMYDFHKVHLGDHKSMFVHAEFDPKKKESIHLIRRKVTFQQKQQSQKEEGGESSIHKTDKENYNLFYQPIKSSRKVLCKNSIKIIPSENSQNQDKTFDELVSLLQPHTSNKDKFREMVNHYKTDLKYRSYLIRKTFQTRLFAALGVERRREADCCSVFSIDQGLEYNNRATRKSFAPKSLKYLDSGLLYYRKNTTRNLLLSCL